MCVFFVEENKNTENVDQCQNRNSIGDELRLLKMPVPNTLYNMKKVIKFLTETRLGLYITIGTIILGVYMINGFEGATLFGLTVIIADAKYHFDNK
jgi:hypothetical protein